MTEVRDKVDLGKMRQDVEKRRGNEIGQNDGELSQMGVKVGSSLEMIAERKNVVSASDLNTRYHEAEATRAKLATCKREVTQRLSIVAMTDDPFKYFSRSSGDCMLSPMKARQAYLSVYRSSTVQSRRVPSGPRMGMNGAVT